MTWVPKFAHLVGQASLPRTVVIIGSAGPWLDIDRDGVERWGINNSFRKLPGGFHFDQWDRWFDLHPIPHIRRKRSGALNWYEMQNGRRPVYLLEECETIPGSVAYPIEEVQRYFAPDPDDPESKEEYFTSSVDYLIALALMEGVDRIELYGVDMYAGHERQHRDVYRKNQREGASYWIGRARGLGVTVTSQVGSSICRAEQLYGYAAPTSAQNYQSVSWQRFRDQLAAAREKEAHATDVVA